MKQLAIVALMVMLAFTLAPVARIGAARVGAQGRVVRLTLIDENGSGEDGSAQLTDQGDGTTKVELLMLNVPEGDVQPAAIREGTCAALGADMAYKLEDVKESKSTTTVKVALDDLLKEKYAISVHKSASDALVISCGNLPSAAAVSGAMTLDQVLTELLNQANELLATVKKQEVDGSQNAYNLYRATFAAYEGEIQAKSAPTQATLETAMGGIRDALQAGDWAKSEAAAEALVTAVEKARGDLGGGAGGPGGAAVDALAKLQPAAADLLRETTNKDKDGSQRAYDAYHALFAANEDAIRAQNTEAWQRLENAMNEVRDALAAGDLTKAAAAANELQTEVNDAMREMGGTANSLPTSGNGSLPLLLGALAGLAMALLIGGLRLQRSTR